MLFSGFCDVSDSFSILSCNMLRLGRGAGGRLGNQTDLVWILALLDEPFHFGCPFLVCKMGNVRVAYNIGR